MPVNCVKSRLIHSYRSGKKFWFCKIKNVTYPEIGDAKFKV